LAPYALLLALLLSTRLVPPLRGFLADHLHFAMAGIGQPLDVLYNPGLCLAATCLGAVALLGLSPSDAFAACRRGLRQWVPVALVTLLSLALAQVMQVNGLTPTLARATARTLGGTYLWAVPVVGAVGGFLTGSNTGGNALFMAFQTEAARRLGLPVAAIAAVQNTAASNATWMSATRLTLTSAALARPGREGLSTAAR
jgi:lactate permease